MGHYVIVTNTYAASDSKSFEKDINEYIDKGYMPIGGLAVIKNDNGKMSFYQALFTPSAKSSEE